MGDLSVRVCLNGLVIEDRVLKFRRLVRLGEDPEAAISFPGADIAAMRVNKGIAVRGRVLAEGESMALSLGPVWVRLAHTSRRPSPSEWAGTFDVRFMVAALLVVAVGTWMDSVEGWLDVQSGQDGAGLVSRVHQVIEVVRDGARPDRSATLNPNTEPSEDAQVQDLADGPRHEPDDAVTGIGWARWYRQAVPDSDDQLIDALERLEVNPDDANARRVLARAAYDRDDYDQAASHYRWLVDNYPDERDTRLRLAWAEKRRGHHRAEIEQYQQILRTVPDDIQALGGLAMALARTNRLDEAAAVLDELMVSAPDTVETEDVIATIQAQQGHDRAALAALDRVFSGRASLSREAQLELRRSLALDPAFASLRRNRRTLTLVARHLGAAAPRPVR